METYLDCSTIDIFLSASSGGPCSGKSTGKNYIMEKLDDFGRKVFFNHEVATLMIEGGVDPKKLSRREFLTFEREILLNQLYTEASLLRMAKEWNNARINGQGFRGDAIVLTDRGAMDVKAYLNQNEWHTILEETGLHESQLLGRYKLVTHLLTAAIGAEEYYTLENNKARQESTLEEARLTDEKTREAWLGTGHLVVIDNNCSFEQKMKRLLQVLCGSLGIPVPLEKERKFLVESVNINEFPAHRDISIEQIYLISQNSDEEVRIRRRGIDNRYVYYLTKKTKTCEIDTRTEVEDRISARDFCILSEQGDPKRIPIRKMRRCFLYENQYFELDFLEKTPWRDEMILLELESTEVQEELVLPPFIEFDSEVTGVKGYSNSELALIPV